MTPSYHIGVMTPSYHIGVSDAIRDLPQNTDRLESVPGTIQDYLEGYKTGAHTRDQATKQRRRSS